MTLLTYRYARVCPSLPHGYVKTYLGGIYLRSLLIVPGAEPTSPDSIPILISSLRLNPRVMDLIRNCCFYCWMNVRKYSGFFDRTVSFLKEKPRGQSAFSWHPPAQFQMFKKKSPNLAMCLCAEVLSEIWNQGELCFKSPLWSRPMPAATLGTEKRSSSRAVFWLACGAQQKHSLALSWLFCFF